MDFFYCFSNTSLTERVLVYLSKKLKRYVDSVTVIFLNDCWVVRLKLKANIDVVLTKDCLAVLNESGVAYQASDYLARAVKALDAGSDVLSVTSEHHIAIISHGAPTTEELGHFRERFVAGLGYCPPSLV